MSNRLHHLLYLMSILLLNACQTSSKQDPPTILTNAPITDGGSTPHNSPADSGNTVIQPPLPESLFQSKVCSNVYTLAAPYAVLPGTLLLEISGMSPSLLNENILWAHNDSGDAAQIYAVHKNGTHLATVTLADVVATDFEDMASGFCPNRQDYCLYIADVGDNRHERETLQIHILKEPVIDESLSEQTASYTLEKTITLTFSGEKPNIEAFVVNNQNNRGYLFEKADNQMPRLFIVDLEGANQQTIGDTSTFSAPRLPNSTGVNTLITAGAYHSQAKRLVLKTYAGVFEYRFVGDQTLEDIADVTPIIVSERPAWELQGESITYSYLGDTILTSSEDPTNVGSQQVSEFRCTE